MRTVLCVLLFASAAVADPLTISYRRQERRVNFALSDTLTFDLKAYEITGPIMGGPQDNPFRHVGTWRTTLAKNAIGQIQTLTAGAPEFAAFVEAGPGLVPLTYRMLMQTPTLDQANGDELWPVPISPPGQLGSPPFPFALNRVEVQLVEYFTSPIGSVVQFAVRVIGAAPEPATAGLVFVLCLGLLHVRRR